MASRGAGFRRWWRTSEDRRDRAKGKSRCQLSLYPTAEPWRIRETPMDPVDDNEAKAHKAQILLYVIMGLFILAPFVVYWLRR